MHDSTDMGPNAALGHVTDAIDDLDTFGSEQLDDAGQVAAKHAHVLLREAMGYPVSPADLLAAARYLVDLARDGRSAAAGSLVIDLDHQTTCLRSDGNLDLACVAEALRYAASVVR